MKITHLLMLSSMIFAGIDDMFCMSIHEINWIIMHILLFIIDIRTAIILPFYLILKKFPYIGLGDWIVFLAAIIMSNDYYTCFAIAYLFILAFVDIKEKKSPIILPISLAVLITSI